MNNFLNKIFKKPRRLVIVAVLAAGLFFSGFAVDSFFEITKNIDIFSAACREISVNYVDETKPGELIKKAIDGMLASLDPYTVYIPESEIEDYKMTHVSRQYGGVGALIHEKDGHIYISEPYEGFPAQKAGIWAGDEILEVNGNAIKAPNTAKVSEMLKGQKGAIVKVLLKRNKETYERTMLREDIKIDNVSYYGTVADSIGYIKLTAFLENSGQEVKDALINLEKNNHIKAIVLDLRGNGGGILQEAVKIVNLFVEKGSKIVSQRGKQKEKDVEYMATEEPVDIKIPLVILVDRNSASASEIVTGATQELDRGVIIGQRSFGKGLVQQTFNLPYNTLVKITIAKYYTPSGRCIQALDYTHRKANGIVDKVADSVMTEFKTAHGRFVYDGNGIYPDIKTEPERFSNAAYTLAAKLLIFDFATQYRYAHANIPVAKCFNISDKEYDDFVTYLKNKDYSYTSKTESTLNELKKSTETEKYYDGIKEEYKALQDKINENKKNDLQRYKTEIKELLEGEIASRYYYQKGRIESSFKYDQDIKEAVRVLDNRKLYASILMGEGDYKTIGKPQKKSELTASTVEKP